MNNKNFKNSSDQQCIGPNYPPNTLFYHPQNFLPLKINNVVCPIDISNKLPYKISNKNHDTDFLNHEILGSILPPNNSEFLSRIYDINTFSDIDSFIINNHNLNYISKSRIINSIYKVYKLNHEFPSDLFCITIKNILLDNFNINIPSSKIKKKIVINKKNNNWHNIFDFFIFNYSK
jgi:hypothetical protein